MLNVNKARCCCFLAVMVVGALSASGEPLLDQSDLDRAGLVKFWEAHLPLAAGDAIADGYLVDEAIYVVTEAGTLFSIQADVGLLRWGYKLADRHYRVYRPTHLWTGDATGPVIVQTSIGLTLLDRFSGGVVAQFTPQDLAPSGEPVIGAGRTLFLGSGTDIFRAVLIGHTLDAEPRKRWEVSLDAPVITAPVLHGAGKVLFASQAGTIYSCGAADKVIDWVNRVGGGVVADPVVQAGAVYIASTDRSLYKLDSANGSLLWRRRLSSPLLSAPVVTNDTVFQRGHAFGIAAIDSATGHIRWKHARVRSFAAHFQERDALWTDRGELDLVEHLSGKVDTTIAVRGAVGVVTNSVDDALYLLGTGGAIFCARPDGVPYLRYQQVNAARARLNLPPMSRHDAANHDAAHQADGKPADQAQPVRLDPLRSRRDPGR